MWMAEAGEVAQAPPYVPYEDLQKDLRREPLVSRIVSSPNLPSEVFHGATTSGIARPGGFRREHMHSRGRTGACEAKEDLLLESISNNYSMMASFYLSLDDLRAQELFGETPLASTGRHPGMSNIMTSVAILKSFVSCGILYLPNGFAFGGWGTSLILMLIAGLGNSVGLWMLAECHGAHRLPYPELARLALGPWGARAISVMLVISQWAFTVSGVVVVARSFHDVLSGYGVQIPLVCYYSGQLLVLVPLSWIRRISKMGFTNMLGNGIIATGVIAVVCTASVSLAVHGVDPAAVAFKGNWMTFIGTAVYAFEGIGLAIPIREAMMKQEDFYLVMSATVVLIGCMLSLVGIVGYLAWGPTVSPVVINEIPGGLAKSVLILFYAVAIFCAYPLTLYPTVTIIEQHVFTQSQSTARKWYKNVFRAILTLLGITVAYKCGELIEIFVSLVGCFFAIPIGLLWPPIIHSCLFPGKNPVLATVLIGFGAAAASVCVAQNVWLIHSWAEGK